MAEEPLEESRESNHCCDAWVKDTSEWGGGDYASHLYVNVYVKGHPTTHPITTNPLEGPSCCVSEHPLLGPPIPPDNEAHSSAILAIPSVVFVKAVESQYCACRPAGVSE